MLLKSAPVQTKELAKVFSCLPSDATGLSPDAALDLWRQWHQQGSLLLGRVDAIQPDGSLQLQALGVSVWLTDAAVAQLAQPGTQSCIHRLYRAAQLGHPWVMGTREIEQAHEARRLNLMILHFWSAVDVSSAAFEPVFLQAHAGFRDLHQGFGIARLLQECPMQQTSRLEAAGLHVVHHTRLNPTCSVAWMEICAEDARAYPGTTFSFLFMAQDKRLHLKPAVQRMLLLALRQLTDEDIAQEMECTRDYVRKLWVHAYACMEETGVLQLERAASLDRSRNAQNLAPKRGRERRRAALEFLRANPHELRPSLPKVNGLRCT